MAKRQKKRSCALEGFNVDCAVVENLDGKLGSYYMSTKCRPISNLTN